MTFGFSEDDEDSRCRRCTAVLDGWSEFCCGYCEDCQRKPDFEEFREEWERENS